jgi:hypothetical protein
MVPSNSNENNSKTVTESVAVFDNAKALEAAIDELQLSGFHRSELSLLASEKAIEDKLGHLYYKVDELEDDSEIPRAAYVANESVGSAEGALIGGLMYVGAGLAAGTVVASGGTMAAVLIAAAQAGGVGGLVGAVLASVVSDEHALRIEEQLNHGGLLLWVRTRDEAHEKTALEILKRHSGRDVHLHELTP